MPTSQIIFTLSQPNTDKNLNWFRDLVADCTENLALKDKGEPEWDSGITIRRLSPTQIEATIDGVVDWAEFHRVWAGEVPTRGAGFGDDVIITLEVKPEVVLPELPLQLRFVTDEMIAEYAARLPSKHEDGGVIGLEFRPGQEADPEPLQWNADDKAPYTSGETLSEYGIHNLRQDEAARCGIAEADLAVAKDFFDVNGQGISMRELARERARRCQTLEQDQVAVTAP